MRHEAVPVGLLARVIVHQRRDEMELQVGRLEIGTALEERARFQPLSRRQPVAEQHVLQAGLRAAPADWPGCRA